MLCLGAGLLSGQLIKRNNNPADAASAYITVSDNNQIVTVDQATGGQVIQRTSTVTIKDPTATSGYILSAKLSQNTISGASVTIGSASSTTCTIASPCNLNSSSARNIISTSNGNATASGGEKTIWQVNITIPAGTAIGNYIVDVEYSEEATFAMQDFTGAKCETAPTGATFVMKDNRDGTYYRVKKMADGNCWMVDNLALDLTSDYSGKPSWNTAPVTVSGTDASVSNVPQQVQNNNVVGQGQIPNNGTTKASYLYNWCAALADTSAVCTASVAATTNNTVINGATVSIGTDTYQPEVTGICPAPFRLPKGGPNATISSSASTANEFAKLDIAMGGTGGNRTSGNTYSQWLGTAATNTNWLGVLSGLYVSNLNYQGINSRWWSSTAYGAGKAYELSLNSNSTAVYPGGINDNFSGFAVRCVLNPSDSDLTQISTMQEMSEHVCSITAAGAMKSLRDERDGTYYRVKKMVDGNCWMVDNLALDLATSYTGRPSWGTVPVTVSYPTQSLLNKPQQTLINNLAGQGQIQNNGVTKASYLYNWCAALADTSVRCSASAAATQFNTVVGGAVDSLGTATTQTSVTGICPAPFRLPKGGPGASESSVASTASEFSKLDIAMGGTGANRLNANTYTLWTGVAAAETNWLGVLSGDYSSATNNQGERGGWWSSTALGPTVAYLMLHTRTNNIVYPEHTNDKSIGRAVRCLL